MSRRCGSRGRAPREEYRELRRGWLRRMPKQFAIATPIRRFDIDSAMYQYFEQVGRDIEATRPTILDARDRKFIEVRHRPTQGKRRAR